MAGQLANACGAAFFCGPLVAESPEDSPRFRYVPFVLAVFTLGSSKILKVSGKLVQTLDPFIGCQPHRVPPPQAF